MNTVLRLESVCKSFPVAGGELEILKDVNLSLSKGEGASIVGKSGSGKSTLLYIAALIEKPTSGTVWYSDSDVTSAGDASLAALRKEKMGFVFQNSLLLDDFSALENVMIPLMNTGVRKKDAQKRASELLDRLGLAERLDHRPFELSGGERQRVAIARSVICEPDIIFADEPTGSLDEESQILIENLLLSLVHEKGLALLLVTHNETFASRLEHRYILSHKELRAYEE